MLLTFATLAVNLLVFGAHALLPLRAARGDAAVARLWSRAALPALGLASATTLFALRRAPDAALAWGITGPLTGPLALRLLLVAFVALVAADLLALVGGDRLGRREWLVIGVFGALALVLVTWVSEMLRFGAGPVPMPGPLLAGALLRVPLALAAAELAVGRPRLFTLLAGPALLVAVPLWPLAHRAALGVDLLTLASGAAVLAGSRALPARLGRLAGVAGLLLVTLFLARSVRVAETLGTSDHLPVELLAP